MIILSLDYSFAKSGVCVAKIDNHKIRILYSELLVSNKKLEPINRIIKHIKDIEKVIDKYKPSVYIKEGSIIGKSSTAKYVLYAHAILEYVLYEKGVVIEDVHNATLKAYCRKYLIEKKFYTKEELKQFNKKAIVAEFLKYYFSSDMPEIYTKRGKLLDDVSDAIALSCFYFENNLKDD